MATAETYKLLLAQALLFVPTFHRASLAGNVDIIELLLSKVSDKKTIHGKTPIARLSEPDIPLKRTKKVRLDICHTQIRLREHDIVTILGQ